VQIACCGFESTLSLGSGVPISVCSLLSSSILQRQHPRYSTCSSSLGRIVRRKQWFENCSITSPYPHGTSRVQNKR